MIGVMGDARDARDARDALAHVARCQMMLGCIRDKGEAWRRASDALSVVKAIATARLALELTTATWEPADRAEAVAALAQAESRALLTFTYAVGDV